MNLKKFFSIKVRFGDEHSTQDTLDDINNGSFKGGLIRTFIILAIVLPLVLGVVTGFSYLFLGEAPATTLLLTITMGYFIYRLYKDSYTIAHQELKGRLVLLAVTHMMTNRVDDAEAKAIIEQLISENNDED